MSCYIGMRRRHHTPATMPSHMALTVGTIRQSIISSSRALQLQASLALRRGAPRLLSIHQYLCCGPLDALVRSGRGRGHVVPPTISRGERHRAGHPGHARALGTGPGGNALRGGTEAFGDIEAPLRRRHLARLRQLLASLVLRLPTARSLQTLEP